MSAQKRILRVIPEKMLREELGWFQEKMGEFAVRTYIIRKPEIIAKNLELIGINARFCIYKDEDKKIEEESGEADLVFKSNKTYYLVETKRPLQYKSGWTQVLRAVECFQSEMEMNRQEYEEVFAVLVTTDPFAEILKEDPPFVIEENGKLTTVE
jgi:hypothetical protein